LCAVFGVSDRQLAFYDARTTVLRRPDDLARLEEQAAHEKRPLYVAYTGQVVSRGRAPEIMSRLHEATSYQHVATFWGLEEMFSCYIYYRPAPQ
jgi:hypothetical protein